MAQYQITVDLQTLHQLFITKSKDSGVSALLESALNQILQAEASEHLQVELYERNDKRQGYRNGRRPHNLTTQRYQTYFMRNILDATPLTRSGPANSKR